MGFLYKPKCRHDSDFAFPAYFDYALIVNGSWPTDGDELSMNYSLRSRAYTLWNWFNISSMALLTISQAMYFFLNITDVNKAVESTSSWLNALHLLLRFIHMRIAVKKLKVLLGLFADKIWINRKVHPNIYDRCIRNLKPSLYLSLSLVGAFVIYNILPIVKILNSSQTLTCLEKNLPYLMAFPYDHQRPLFYIMTYIFVFYAGLVIILQSFAMDTLMAVSLNFLTGQFEILHGRILRLIPECHAEWRSSHFGRGRNVQSVQRMYTRRLHKLAKFHNDLISFSKVLQEFYSFPLIVNFVSAMLLVCFVGFQFVRSGSNSLGDFARLFLYLVYVIGQLYVTCNMGSKLISQSTLTAVYLYKCNWEGGHISQNSPLLLDPTNMELEELDVRLPLWRYVNYHPADAEFRQSLRLMMMQTQRPVQLTAMKLTVLSLETYNRIISSSMSYFALLNTIVDGQNST